MRGVAASDLHLGFTQLSATEGGRNVREMDVERAWIRAVDRMIESDPDLITIAGDVFHSVRPSNWAIKAWQDGINRLLRETLAHIIVIGGNHETPKSRSSLSPNVLGDTDRTVFGDRLRIVDDVRAIVFRTRDGERVAVTCLPFNALAGREEYRVEPLADVDVNVLLIHAAVRSDAADEDLPRFYAGAHAIEVSELAEKFDVLAAGDFHEYRRLHPDRLAFYSGAIERTSSNIWAEEAPKGVVRYEYNTGEEMDYVIVDGPELLEIETRTVTDYALGDCELMIPNRGEIVTAENVNMALQTIAGFGGHDGRIVRLKVDGFPRGERDQLDEDAIRAIRSKTLHFALDVRYASAEVGTVEARVHTGTIAAQAETFFADAPAPVRERALYFLSGQGD